MPGGPKNCPSFLFPEWTEIVMLHSFTHCLKKRMGVAVIIIGDKDWTDSDYVPLPSAM